jgi:hypothetical protein
VLTAFTAGSPECILPKRALCRLHWILTRQHSLQLGRCFQASTGMALSGVAKQLSTWHLLPRWQPVLEHDGHGTISAQTHTTPHLLFGKPFAMTRKEYEAVKARKPFSDRSVKELLAATYDILDTSAKLTDR